MNERFKAQRAREDAFRAELESKHKTETMPDRVRDLIWKKAWDDGHSYGFHEVEMHYLDLTEIVHAAADHGMEKRND